MPLFRVRVEALHAIKKLYSLPFRLFNRFPLGKHTPCVQLIIKNRQDELGKESHFQLVTLTMISFCTKWRVKKWTHHLPNTVLKTWTRLPTAAMSHQAGVKLLAQLLTQFIQQGTSGKAHYNLSSQFTFPQLHQVGQVKGQENRSADWNV